MYQWPYSRFRHPGGSSCENEALAVSVYCHGARLVDCDVPLPVVPVVNVVVVVVVVVVGKTTVVPRYFGVWKVPYSFTSAKRQSLPFSLRS